MSTTKCVHFFIWCIFIVGIDYGNGGLIEQQYLVETKNGFVKGKDLEAIDGKTAIGYFGIPYAKPPVGDLRFRRPEPAESWSDVLEATVMSPDCHQNTYPMYKSFKFMRRFINFPPFSEDCLKLNVYTPENVQSGDKLPVMVLINGGGFSRGGASAKFYDGSVLATQEQVLVVTLNYRVGAFGFLFMDHEDVPGNMGLLDQVMALQWVQDNIASFGGDPDLVTIFGQSAGAASVTYHCLSPLSQGLFKRGIIESGTPHPLWGHMTQKNALKLSQTLIENLGCPTTGNEDAIRCLKEVDPLLILKNEPSIETSAVFTFIPITDNYFVLDDPWLLLEKGEVKKTEILIGSNKDEATLFLSLYNPLYFNPLEEPVDFTPDTIKQGYNYVVDFPGVSYEVIKAFYFDPVNNNHHSNMEYTIDVANDYIFFCHSNLLEEHMRTAGNKVYKYFYVHHSSNSKWPSWFGSFHSAEMQYVLGEPLRVKELNTEEEMEFSRKIMRYWSNFARTGDPNQSALDLKFSLPEWPISSIENKEYLVLSSKYSAVNKFFRAKSCHFILDVLPKIKELENRNFTTC